ncbi:MAG TPA: hypothetical protein P5154_01825 [Candidatus Izemoplasmatales bacterium]|nr:hypothetical protein [Bacillota bacterium]HRY77484.1 hypothetical protein [Candidatus Izemoplasmatales bacterium]
MKDGQRIGEMENGFCDNEKNEEMDIMKSPKIFLFLLILCLSFSLFSCGVFSLERQYFLYDLHDRDTSEIVQISLINYVNPQNEENPSQNEQYNVEKLIILETLNSDEFGNFVSELSEMGGIAGTFPEIVSSPNGKGILITYQDGGFILITVSQVNDDDCIFFGDYNSNGTFEYSFGISWSEMIADFKTLILSYFEVEI